MVPPAIAEVIKSGVSSVTAKRNYRIDRPFLDTFQTRVLVSILLFADC